MALYRHLRQEKEGGNRYTPSFSADALLPRLAPFRHMPLAASNLVASLQTAVEQLFWLQREGACYSGLDARLRREPLKPRVTDRAG